MTWLSLSQNGQKETGVYLNRQITTQLISGLINCDYNKKENEILTNSLEQYEIITNHFRQLVKESIAEIQKRDDIIDKQDLAMIQAETTISDLKIALQKEIKRKKANKWIYLGLGAVGGVMTYKILN
jgi:hypothetical protein